MKEVASPQIKPFFMSYKRIDVLSCPFEVNMINAFLQERAHTCDILHAHGRFWMRRLRHMTEQVNPKRNLLVRIPNEVIPIAPFYTIPPCAKKTGTHLPDAQSLQRTTHVPP